MNGQAISCPALSTSLIKPALCSWTLSDTRAKRHPGGVGKSLAMHRSQSPACCWVDVRGESSIIHFLLLHLLVCIFIKAIVCHVKQLLQHKEKLSNNMAFWKWWHFPLHVFFLHFRLPSLQSSLPWPRTAFQTRILFAAEQNRTGTRPALFSASSAVLMGNRSPLLPLLEAPSAQTVDWRLVTSVTCFLWQERAPFTPQSHLPLGTRDQKPLDVAGLRTSHGPSLALNCQPSLCCDQCQQVWLFCVCCLFAFNQLVHKGQTCLGNCPLLLEEATSPPTLGSVLA